MLICQSWCGLYIYINVCIYVSKSERKIRLSGPVFASRGSRSRIGIWSLGGATCVCWTQRLWDFHAFQPRPMSVHGWSQGSVRKPKWHYGMKRLAHVACRGVLDIFFFVFLPFLEILRSYCSLFFRLFSAKLASVPKTGTQVGKNRHLSAQNRHLKNNKYSGTEKTHKHEQICGIVPGLGGRQNFVYVFFRVIPYGGERTHKQNSPKNPGTIPWRFCLRVFSLCECVFFFAP